MYIYVVNGIELVEQNSIKIKKKVWKNGEQKSFI